LAIKAHTGGATGSTIIDTTDKFEQNDMLHFDQAKNLFVRGIKISDFARSSDLQELAQTVGSIDLTPYAKISDIPSLDGLATTIYVDQKIASAASGGEIDLSSYVTITALQQQLSQLGQHFSGDYNDLTNKPNIPSLDGLASEAYVGAFVQQQLSGYQPTIDLSSYYTKTEVDNLTQNTFSGNYNDLIGKPTLFSGDYNDLSNQPMIPSIDGLASTTYVDQQITLNAPDLSSYASVQYVDDQIASALTGGSIDLSSYVTETELTTALSNYQPTIDLSSYYTKTEVDALIPAVPSDVSQLTDTQGLLNHVDTSNFATTSYVNVQLQSYQPLTDMSLYALKTDLFSTSYNDLTDKPVMFSGDYNDLVNRPTVFSGNYNDLYNQPMIPSIDGLASVAYVDQQIANVSGGGSVDLSSYVTETELTTALSNYQPTVDLSNYALKTELFDGNYTSLTGIPTIPTDISDLTDTTNLLSSNGGNVDLTGYATQTYVQQQIGAATLGAISNLDDLNDVAVGSLPQQANLSEHYLLEYNPVNQLWESKDFGSIFATQQYVTETIATIVTDGDINLDGYATEQFVEQKLTEIPAPFSGDYFDLANRPILFSGDFNDLINTPAGNNDLRMQLVGQELQLINIEPEPDTIISRVSLDSLGDAIAANISYNDIADLPNLFSGDYGDLVNRPQLFSGNYADLRNKPYIPSIAGLASEEYVDNRWAEPEITGDRFFTHDLIVKESNLDSHTAQKRMTAYAIQTTNNTPTQVVDRNGDPLTFSPNTTVMIEVSIVAAGVDVNDSAATKHKGIVTVDDTNAQFVGIVAQEILEMGNNGWTSTIYTNDNGGRQLHIEVTGSASHTVNWTVFIESYEVVNV
jgi:hypothetical protein